MSTSRHHNIALATITTILSRRTGVQEIAWYVPFSKSTVANTLRKEQFAKDEQIINRAALAPKDALLAFDFVNNEHIGKTMEGLSPQYCSSAKGVRKSHKFASSALVKFGHEPTPLNLEFKVSKELETDEYAYKTPSECIIEIVKKFIALGIYFVGVVADAEFLSNTTLQYHVENNIGLLTRIKSNRRIKFEGKSMSVANLATLFPSKKCCPNQKLDWRSKRIPVTLDDLKVDILLIYRKQDSVWVPFFLLSTFSEEFSMAKLLEFWKARWGIEVIHRYIKQNLSFGKCYSPSIKAQQNWASLVLDAFIAVLTVKKQDKSYSWRKAQKIAAAEHVDHAVIALSPTDYPLEAA